MFLLIFFIFLSVFLFVLLFLKCNFRCLNVLFKCWRRFLFIFGRSLLDERRPLQDTHASPAAFMLHLDTSDLNAFLCLGEALCIALCLNGAK